MVIRSSVVLFQYLVRLFFFRLGTFLTFFLVVFQLDHASYSGAVVCYCRLFWSNDTSFDLELWKRW